jgi:L-lactate dehydrogenase complex protein LldG
VSVERDNILGRVRKALGREGSDETRLAAADAYIAAHAHGPRPRLSSDLVEHFMRRALTMGSSIERIGNRREVPQRVARYLEQRPEAERTHAGVCWPEWADLSWSEAGLRMEPRPATGDDRMAVTGVFCAIAETGTMVIVSGSATPTASIFLPETHVAVVPSTRIVSGMEEAFALLRREHAALPRAVNMVSGPSRTGDIEQTIVLGAHGPYRVHILVL